MSDKPILVLDFDGVLHSYSSGWMGAGVIPDPPVKGAQKFCDDVAKHFRLWIVSSRCNQEGGTEAIRQWLTKYRFPIYVIHVSEDGTKPPAFITLDDRAITFNGIFPSVEWLLTFQPWHKKTTKDHPIERWD